MTMDTPYAPVHSFQGDLMTLTYANLLLTCDMVDKIGELVHETDPYRIAEDVSQMQCHLAAAQAILDRIRP